MYTKLPEQPPITVTDVDIHCILLSDRILLYFDAFESPWHCVVQFNEANIAIETGKVYWNYTVKSIAAIYFEEKQRSPRRPIRSRKPKTKVGKSKPSKTTQKTKSRL